MLQEPGSWHSLRLFQSLVLHIAPQPAKNMFLLHSNARQVNSCELVLQKPVISVHIVPAGEGLPPIHIEPHERSAKKIVDTLREIYGSGNLLDPMGMCVIPRSQRYLAPGYYTFERNPRGELWRDQMLRLDIRGCL